MEKRPMGDEAITEDTYEPAGTTGTGAPDDPYVMPEMPITPENSPVLDGDQPGEPESINPVLFDLVLSASGIHEGDVSGSGTPEEPLVMPEMVVTPENADGS